MQRRQGFQDWYLHGYAGWSGEEREQKGIGGTMMAGSAARMAAVAGDKGAQVSKGVGERWCRLGI